MAFPVTVALAAFCALLLVGLAGRVSLLRMRHNIAFGDGGNPALMRAIRTHGNTAEHAPLFLLLALIFELARGGSGVLIGAAGVFVVARILFTIGVLGRGLHLLRMAGAMLTYLAQASLAVALALVALRIV
ncbi:MAG: MAPEG family protein [Nevskiaceae bacterium]